MSEESKNTFKGYLGPDFQQKLIWQLLVEPEFCKNIIEKISIDYFDDPYLKRLFVIMLEYFREFEKVPNLQNKSIEEAIHKYKSQSNKVEEEVLLEKIQQIKYWNERVINKNQLYDGDVVRKQTIQFIKQQEYRKLAEHIITEIKGGNVKRSTFNFEVEEIFNKINLIGDEENYGTDVIDDIDNALREKFRDTIPTGIEVIDTLTGNGLGRGEIGIIIAPSGTGKTTLLTKIANTAFNEGKKVLQIVFEDTEDQIKRKHYTLWSKIALSEIDDKRELVKDRVLKHVKKIKSEGGKIDIVKFSQEDTTLFDIKNWITRQEKKFGYKYELIVLDYLDCLEPNKRTADLHTAELSIIKSFEAMASEYNIPAWSAIQSNRSGFSADFVEHGHSGGNIKRIQKSHFVMSIAKPNKSDNDNIANIKILKARFAKDGYEFKDCIFNNDTLEIRITDQRYVKGLKVKKYDETDLEKTNNKINELNKGNLHIAINENIVDDESSPTIGSLKLKDGFENELGFKNNDFEKTEDFTLPKEHPQEKVDQEMSQEKVDQEISQEKVNQEISQEKMDQQHPPQEGTQEINIQVDIDDLNPENILNILGDGDDDLNKGSEIDVFLKQNRKNIEN